MQNAVIDPDHLTHIAERFEAANDFSFGAHLVYMLPVGSSLYNCRTPESDYDYVAVVIPPAEKILGLSPWESWRFAEEIDGTTLDVQVHALSRFVTLAAHGNPNIVETLFPSPFVEAVIRPGFRPFQEARDLFVSKQLYLKFSAYATGQFKKMEAGATKGYMGHARKELVQQIGYDPKDASRLLHLLYMAREIAEHGLVQPWLTGIPRAVVMGVKAGTWRLEDVKDLAYALARENEMLIQESRLPETADRAAIEALLVQVLRRRLA